MTGSIMQALGTRLVSWLVDLQRISCQKKVNPTRGISPIEVSNKPLVTYTAPVMMAMSSTASTGSREARVTIPKPSNVLPAKRRSTAT